jgi:hypothetical protein
MELRAKCVFVEGTHDDAVEVIDTHLHLARDSELSIRIWSLAAFSYMRSDRTK